MNGEYQPIYQLRRGEIVESVHFGAVAVVDSSGRLLAWHGDPKTVTYLRSSSKPFQALPFIERGGDQTFHLTSREIAIICGSHDGTDEHVDVVKGIHHDVDTSDLTGGLRLRKGRQERYNRDSRVHIRDPPGRNLRLRKTEYFGRGQNLPVEVVLLEDVGIDHGQAADTEAGQFLDGIASQAAAAHNGNSAPQKHQLVSR